MSNSVPQLIDTLRPTLRHVAEWANVSVGLAGVWQQGTYQPKQPERRKLVKAVRQHAARLLTLARAVEREGEARTTDSGSRPRRARGGRGRISEPVRRSTSRRSAPRRSDGGRVIPRTGQHRGRASEIERPSKGGSPGGAKS